MSSSTTPSSQPIILPVLGSRESYTINPGKIIAVGLNYRDHVKESLTFNNEDLDAPAEPVLFAKTPNVLVGPGQPIIIPEYLTEYHPNPRTDYEAELAIIIGQPCSRLPSEEAREAIFGFTCFNDVSQRNIQKSDPSGWFRGKSLDSFGPIGPAVATLEYLASQNLDPQNLAIAARLNGRTVQSSNTKHMIFTLEHIISFISRHIRLEPGDIIATGTPSGIGALNPGDTIEIEIQGIGTLSNPVDGPLRSA
ncbi:fumarylacetoacetate hydrolase family protein [Spirochaeta lutea]|uniref:fumarylacetoacetate hydrolase family protein n=1 Tax=Spirochaeta lutea TaxID=1480694 RepID=UPI000A41D325|nr:fumarylacetoacetate hydrolase family protein [Spirochaeta lutea]